MKKQLVLLELMKQKDDVFLEVFTFNRSFWSSKIDLNVLEKNPGGLRSQSELLVLMDRFVHDQIPSVF